jgi:hypothetical protein
MLGFRFSFFLDTVKNTVKSFSPHQFSAILPLAQNKKPPLLSPAQTGGIRL